MKKNLFIILLTCIFIFSGIGGAEAKKIYHSSSGVIPKGGGKSENGKVTFFVNSGITYCPVGEELIENDKNRNGLPRNAEIKCMVPDTNPPFIQIGIPDDLSGTCTTNTYSTKIEDVCEYEWSNQDIEFSIETISDPGLGLKKKWYIINGVEYPLNTFPLNLKFSEDGIYKVTIGAEDNSSHYLQDGTVSQQGNIMEYTHIFKIDKFAPILEIVPNNEYIWKKSIPKLSFSIKDRYKGQTIELKTFSCFNKPNNSNWILPVSNSGEVVGTCNPNMKDCTVDTNFVPNQSNCNWECFNGYTKYNGECYLNSQILTCDQNMLPKNSYIYNKDDIIKEEGNITKAYWKGPANIDTSGKFVSFFKSGSYLPNTGECSFDCKDGYHNENGRCVNNVSIVCCKSSYPLVTVAGAKVDCTLPENVNHLQCVYNSLCGGYVKDIVKKWKTNIWEYTDGVLKGDSAASACGLDPIAHSNGDTCNPGYYLVGGGGSTPTCVRVPLGEWSGQENSKTGCTNKPNNATYIAHTNNPLTGKANDCPWVCNNDSKKSGNNCIDTYILTDWKSEIDGNNIIYSRECKKSNGEIADCSKCGNVKCSVAKTLKTSNSLCFAPNIDKDGNINCEYIALTGNPEIGSGPCRSGGGCSGGYGSASNCPTGYKNFETKNQCNNPNNYNKIVLGGNLNQNYPAIFKTIKGRGCGTGYNLGYTIRICQKN